MQIIIQERMVKTLVPVHKFHIPALIIAPNVEKGSDYSKLSSQMDIPSTVLALSGVTSQTTNGRKKFT